MTRRRQAAGTIGAVTLDLSRLVSELGAELGLSRSVLDRVPHDRAAERALDGGKT